MGLYGVICIDILMKICGDHHIAFRMDLYECPFFTVVMDLCGVPYIRSIDSVSGPDIGHLWRPPHTLFNGHVWGPIYNYSSGHM